MDALPPPPRRSPSPRSLTPTGIVAQVKVGSTRVSTSPMSIVVSYALEDAENAKQVYDTLEADYGGRLVPISLNANEKNEAIKAGSHMILILSSNSISSLYNCDSGLGLDVTTAVAFNTKIVLLAENSFKWRDVDSKNLSTEIRSIYLEDPVELGSDKAQYAQEVKKLIGIVTSDVLEATFTVMKTFMLFLGLLIPVGLFLVSFSAMGWGNTVFIALSHYYSMSQAIALVVIGILLILYLLDFSYWTGKWTILKRIFVIFIALGICLGIVLLAKNYPAAPQALFMLGVPIWIIVLKQIFFSKNQAGTFLIALSISLILTALAIIVAWVLWIVLYQGFWNDELRHKYKIMMSCTDKEYCLAAFLLWFSPAIASVACLVFGILASLIGNSLRRERLLGKSKSNLAVKAFGLVLVIAVMGMWIAASVAGASMKMSNVVTMFSAAAAVIMGVIVVATIGWRSLKTKITNMPMVKKLANSGLLDAFRGLLVITSTLFFIVFLALSLLNQLIRKRLTCVKNIFYERDPETLTYAVTQVAHNQIENMRTWKWTAVLVAAVYWGIFFVSIIVGVGKLTTLFLSWLSSTLGLLPLVAVIFIFVGVGLFMFLLPPVPGVPVYICGGIVLTNSATPVMGFWAALVLAIAVCYIIKLLAILMQQQLIGRQMSNSVTVKKFVGVNSISIKAIKKILEVPGLNLPKICILIGGPDWPTSVTTGILKLSWIQMQIGSLPVLVLIAPCVMGGAFQLMKTVSVTWESIASVALTVATAAQSVALLAAMYYIEKAASQHHDELMQMPPDEEVAALERKAAQAKKRYQAVTDWSVLPVFMRTILVLSVIFQALACYMIQFLGDDCFRSFEVSQSIAVHLNGNALNLVIWPLGWISLAMFALSIVLLVVFKLFAKCRIGNQHDSDSDLPLKVRNDSNGQTAVSIN